MVADLSPLAPYVPFDLMVYLSTLRIRFVDVQEDLYAVVRGRLPRIGHPDGIYNGWGDRDHELVIDLLGINSPLRRPHYYGESACDLGHILADALRDERVRPWRSRIYRAMGTTPTATHEDGPAHYRELADLGFDKLRRGSYVYMQARSVFRRREDKAKAR